MDTDLTVLRLHFWYGTRVGKRMLWFVITVLVRWIVSLSRCSTKLITLGMIRFAVLALFSISRKS